jgi:hypothetical protein
LGLISLVAGPFDVLWRGSVILGYLMYRSRFLPQLIGILLALSGIGFVAKTFLWALAPSYSSSLLLMPAGVAWLALTGWLLVKGVDVVKWMESAALADSREPCGPVGPS